jgi:hypothetical protein
MVEYKYENVENVEVKQDFDAWKYNDNGEVTEHILIRQGTKGVVESMNCSGEYGFLVTYDIRFEQDNSEMSVSVSEEKMEDWLILS